MRWPDREKISRWRGGPGEGIMIETEGGRQEHLLAFIKDTREKVWGNQD